MRSKASAVLHLIVVLSMLLASASTIVSAAPPAAPDTEDAPAPSARPLGAPVTQLSEDFESWPPSGWSIVDNTGSCVWESTATTGRTNYAGGDGEAAVADSDWCDTGMDTELQTPALNLSNVPTATLSFVAAYNYLSGDYFEVLVSEDGGASWTQELHWNADHDDDGPGEAVDIDLTPYVGSSNVIVSFHYYAPGWDWWAQVDQVVVKTPPPPPVAFTPPVQSDAGCLGTDVVYDVEILNQSGYTETFDITPVGNDWDTALSATSLTLPDGVTDTLAITVSIPSYAFDGDVDTVEIQATGQTTPTLEGSATIETTAGNVWMEGPTNDPALWPAYASDGSALYYFDGLDEGGDATDQTQIFDPVAGWSTGMGHGLGNFYGGVAGYKANTGEFFYAPGFVDGMSAVDAFVGYDPSTDVWTTTLSARPDALGLGAGGVTGDGDTFVWAGGSPSAGLLSSTPVYTYDIATDTWYTATTLTDLGFTAPGYAMVEDTLYVGGNYLSSDAFYAYDVSDDTWTQLADLPAGKVSPLFIYEPLGNDIYMVGGGDTPAMASAETYIYDIDTDSWEPFADLNNATLGSGGGYLAGLLFTFGGGADTQAAHSSAPHEYSMPQCPDLTMTDLTGQVTNGVTGDPIAGAQVEAVGTGYYTPMSDATPVAWTDADGYYTLTLYAPATYDVTASYSTFDPQTESVDLTVAGPNTQDFVLGPPVANADPLAHSATIEWGETEVQTMTLANDGYSELTFEMVEENGGFEAPVSIRATENDFTSDPEALSFEMAPESEITGESNEPTLFPLSPGFPAYGMELYFSDSFYNWPDVDVPGTWNLLNALSTSGHYAGEFAGDDFSQFYAVNADSNTLFSFDTTTGAATSVGSCTPNTGQSWTGMAWDFTTDTMYAIAIDGGTTATLYTIDLATGAATPVTNITGAIWTIDIAIDAAGQMYSVDIATDALWAIDKVTGAGTNIGSLGVNANYAQGLDYDTASGILYWASFSSSGALRVIDTTTGASALVAGFPGGAEVGAFSVASAPEAGDIPWLSEDPVTGTVAMQDVISPLLTFDAGAVTELGTYTGTLLMPTNDPDAESIDMPVEMTVVENPDAGRIEGTVTSDRPGGPIEGATVFLEAASGFTATLTTDDVGTYEQMILPADLGVFTITVSAPDYLTDVATETVGTTTVIHNVELVYNGPEMLVAPDFISETVTWGDVATATMTITNDGETDLDYDIYDYSVVYSEDFEADDGGYTVGGANPTWEWGEPTSGPGAAYSGLNVWATNLAGNYNNSEDSYIESPDIDLSAYAGSAITVEWWEYADVEPGWDAWFAQASNDGGETWTDVYGWWTGTTGGWDNASVSLSPSYAVSDFRIRFGFFSDFSVNSYDGYYVDDVRITVDPAWKSESVNSGTVISHTTDTVTVTLDSSLASAPGVYEAVEDVMGNDVMNPQEIVPVTFTVLDNPDQAHLSGTVWGNRTEAGMDMPLEGALVHVENVTHTFEAETDASGFYELYMLPSMTGTYSVTISYPGYSDDVDSLSIDNGDDLVHTATLELISPYLNADPEMISETLAWGGTADVTLTISNSQPATGTLDVSMFELAGSYTPLTVETVRVNVPAVTASALSDEADYLVTPSARPELSLDVSIQNLALGTIDVLIISAEVGWGNPLDGFDAMLAAFPDLNVDVYPMMGVPELSELLPYDVVFVGNNNNWPLDNEALGDVMADYVDNGGKVILAQASMYIRSGTNFELGGRWEAEGYSPLTYSDTLATGASLDVYQATHPIMANVNYVDDYTVHGTGHMLQSGAETVAFWDDGEIYIAALPDVVAFNQLLTGGNDWDGDVPTLLHNAILYLAPADVPWLSESVTDFSLDVGEQATSTISLDASVAAVDQPGTYTAWLWLENNDVLQTGAYVPVNMTVLSDPDMAYLEGTVTSDRLQEPMEGAMVMMDMPAEPMYMPTDDAGEFEHWFMPSEAGTYTTTVSMPGYVSETIMVDIVTGTVTTLDVELKMNEPWLDYSAPDLDVTLLADTQTTQTMTLENIGQQPLDFTFNEYPPTATLPSAIETQAMVGPMEIEPAVEQDLAADDSGGYLIYLRAQPDLTPAYSMDWEARGEFVVNALQEVAQETQASLLAYLDAQGAEYQSFWIDNVIVVENSNFETFQGVTTFSQVWAIRDYRQPILHEPESASLTVPQAIEPNLTHVGADQVWADGFEGDGLVLANIDTGVRYTHEALVDHYRGNMGGGTFDHDYSWWDPYDDTMMPNDPNGHGSHTAGIMVGDDGADNQIGMAPGAQWIACQSFEGGPADVTASLLECGQFMAAPWDLTGSNPDPDMRPHVVNNSWGDCETTMDPWYKGVIDSWLAAGIYPVFSNGNASNCGYSSPPGLNTVGNPARYGNVTGVGSTGRDNGQYAPHSNWGPTDDPDTINPVPGHADLKPQVMAPGVSIRSSVGSGDSDYASYGGTSMSAPHVAGLIALMWEAAPCLVGDYAATETIIEETATPIPYDDGTGGGATVPNQATGWGEINAPAAVEAAITECGRDVPWFATDPVTGTIDMAGTQDVAVQFDATDMEPGVYTATLVLRHNDPLTGSVQMSVRMTVYDMIDIYLPMVVRD